MYCCRLGIIISGGDRGGAAAGGALGIIIFGGDSTALSPPAPSMLIAYIPSRRHGLRTAWMGSRGVHQSTEHEGRHRILPTLPPEVVRAELVRARRQDEAFKQADQGLHARGPAAVQARARSVHAPPISGADVGVTALCIPYSRSQ